MAKRKTWALKKHRVYKVTPKSGVNADFQEMFIVSDRKKNALHTANSRTGILERDLMVSRFKPNLSTEVGRTTKQELSA